MVTADGESDSQYLQLKGRNNIECIVIRNSDVAYQMENIDLVMVGAEAVVKNGGILNKVSSLTILLQKKYVNLQNVRS